MAQAVIRWPLAAKSRLQFQAGRGICGGRSGNLAHFFFLLVLRPRSVRIIPPMLHLYIRSYRRYIILASNKVLRNILQ